MLGELKMGEECFSTIFCKEGGGGVVESSLSLSDELLDPESLEDSLSSKLLAAGTKSS